MIESAKYTEFGSILAVIDGVAWTVPDDLANRDRQAIAAWEAEGNAIGPYIEPPENQPYRLYKSIFINRLISNEEVDEAVIMEAVLAAADAKLRLLFNSVEYFVSDDPLFATLHDAVAGALGQQRADELLAAEPAENQ